MSVKVSVILPTFNRSETLEMAAKSVLNQSFTDLELIIVDDASTEDIRDVVDALDDNRVRYIRRESNGGAPTARNTGISAALGEFIAFQDSDDIWLPNKLEKQFEIFSRLPKDVGVVTGSKILYGRDSDGNYGPGKVTIAPAPGNLLRLDEDQVRSCLAINRMSEQNGLFRRNCFPPDEAWFDPRAKANTGWEFTTRLVQNTRIYEDPEPVVLAFISHDSISKSSRKKILGFLRIMKTNRDALKKYPDVLAEKQIILGRMLFKNGKKRMAAKFILQGIKKTPLKIFEISSATRRYRKIFAFFPVLGKQ